MKIKLAEVTVTYPSGKALSDVTLHVRRGEYIAIVGPNGSGKSTLLKTMSGYLSPVEGKVYLNGEEVLKMKRDEVARFLTVLAQEHEINLPYSVRQTVLLGRAPHQRRFASDSASDVMIAEQAMKMTETIGLADRLMTEISGGERQRVFLAMCLAQEPSIFLLDEPVAHLDAKYQLLILRLLKDRSKKDGMTVVVVLHDLNLAAAFADRVILLEKGKIASAGVPGQVFRPDLLSRIYQIPFQTVKQKNEDLMVFPKLRS